MIGRRVLALALTALLVGCGEAEPAARDCGVLELSRDGGMIEARFTVREADHWQIVLTRGPHRVAQVRERRVHRARG